jgi:polysaccharide pyruvyl transferase WcaK-like protein
VKQIVVLGEYAIQSLGDEAMLHGLCQGIAERLGGDVGFTPIGRLVLVPFDGEEFQEQQDRMKASIRASDAMLEEALGGCGQVLSFLTHGRGSPMKMIEQADLIILGGGALFLDINPSFLYGPMQFFASMIGIADALDIPIYAAGMSVGPLKHKWGRKMAAAALGKCAALTVRDKASQELTQGLGVEAELIPDPACLLRPVDTIDSKGQWIMVSPRYMTGSDYLPRLAGALDRIIDETGAHVLMIPHCRFKRTNSDNDEVVCKYVITEMKRQDRVNILQGLGAQKPALALNVYGHAEASLTVRLHGAVFSALAGTPFVALNYWPKVKGFCEWVDGTALPLKSDGWVDAFLDVWERRDEERVRLEARAAELRALALRHVDIVEGLLS